jgi:hypothetical protein
MRGEVTVIISHDSTGLRVSANGSPSRRLVWVSGRTFREGDVHLVFGGQEGEVAQSLGLNPAKGALFVLDRR